MRRTERRLSRIRLRNAIIRHLNAWGQLNTIVRCGDAFQFHVTKGRRETRFFSRLIIGTKGPGGRAVLIYPHIEDSKKTPTCIVKIMMEYEAQGAIVGYACNIGDAWDIVFDDPKEYKRKRRTYNYQKDFERWQYRRRKKREERDDDE